MKKISITISGHRTSISLEKEFHEELKKIAKNKKLSISELIKQIDNSKLQTPNSTLSSQIRIFVLRNKL
ncbi:MAG: ribbon-helix-helix domain-containing protein [Alphaproteobacteria bacterium]|nr:ribbon-helix-helix domain-containing protein [Alphaproteobacteria bacterium]